MTLADDQILLQWIAIDRIPADMFPKLKHLLSDDERARAERFHFEADGLTYVAAHALLRGILADLTGHKAQTLTFKLGPHGKPHPVLGGDNPDIRVNLSHTRGFVVVGAAMGRDIGVDVEALTRPAPLEIASRYFSPTEQALVDATQEAKSETFFALWTLKEAYMKATGRGMNLPLQSFAVDLTPPRLMMSLEDENPDRWVFGQTKLETGHMLAWAADGTRRPQPDAAISEANLGALCADQTS